MADLRVDLINEIKNEKYYDEISLIQLAGDPQMNYKEKIDKISKILDKIAVSDIKLGLVNQYFPQQQAPAPQQHATVAPNQSHVE